MAAPMGSRPSGCTCRCRNRQGGAGPTSLRAGIPLSLSPRPMDLSSAPSGSCPHFAQAWGCLLCSRNDSQGRKWGALSQLSGLRDGGLVGPRRVRTSSQWPEYRRLALSQQRRQGSKVKLPKRDGAHWSHFKRIKTK